jgi:hypothetical protein
MHYYSVFGRRSTAVDCQLHRGLAQSTALHSARCQIGGARARVTRQATAEPVVLISSCLLTSLTRLPRTATSPRPKAPNTSWTPATMVPSDMASSSHSSAIHRRCPVLACDYLRDSAPPCPRAHSFPDDARSCSPHSFPIYRQRVQDSTTAQAHVEACPPGSDALVPIAPP